jgi:hypothetical protein
MTEEALMRRTKLSSVIFLMIMTSVSMGWALTITQPQSGAAFHPGDRVMVRAEPAVGETFQAVFIRTLHQPHSTIDVEAPYEFEFTIDPVFTGADTILVSGKLPNGGIVEAEVQILVTLTPSVVLEGIRVDRDQETLFMQVGSKRKIYVDGTFSDGVVRDVSSTFMGTTYTTSNEKIATVDANGLVTATGPGTAKITIKSGKHELTIEADVESKP